MNNQLGNDENRQCDEESHLHFNVVRKESPPEFPAEGPKGVRSNSGSQATSVITRR